MKEKNLKFIITVISIIFMGFLLVIISAYAIKLLDRNLERDYKTLISWQLSDFNLALGRVVKVEYISEYGKQEFIARVKGIVVDYILFDLDYETFLIAKDKIVSWSAY